MSISSLYASQLLGGTPTTPSIALPSTATTTGTGGSSAATPSFSSLSQMFGKLQQLSTSDPDQFKQVAAQLSTQLSALAKLSSGSNGAFYAALANNFQNASLTGDAGGLSVPAPSGSGTYAVTGRMIANNSIATMLLGGQSDANATSNLLTSLGQGVGAATSSPPPQAPTSTLESLVSQDLAGTTAPPASS